MESFRIILNPCPFNEVLQRTPREGEKGHYPIRRTGTNMPTTAQSRRIGISLRFSSNMQYSYVLYNKVRRQKIAKQQQNGTHFHRRCRITCPNVSRYVQRFSPLLLLLVTCHVGFARYWSGYLRFRQFVRLRMMLCSLQ
jgi:hypothetical protein